MALDQQRLLARIEELEQRLARLEAAPARRAPWGSLLFGSLFVALTLFAVTAPAWVLAQDDKQPPAQEITCKKLTVVDANGKPRVVLAFNDAGGSVKVLNAKEQSTAVLENDPVGGLIRLFAGDGKRLLLIGGNKDGCQVNVCDPDGNIRAYLGCDSAHEGYVTLRDSKNKTTLYCGNDDDGGLVRVSGHDGKERAFFGVGNKQGDGLIILYGTDDKRRHWIGSDADQSSHAIYVKDGVMQHDIRAGKTGSYHTMLHKDGKKTIATIGAANDSGDGILRLNTTEGKTQAYMGTNKNGTGGLLLLNTPQDSSRIVIGIDNNGIGFGEGRDGDNVVRRSMK